MPNPTDWAYLAGFADGEGCITSYRHNQHGMYYPRMTLSQVSPVPLDWVQARWPGHRSILRRERGNMGRWELSGGRLVPVLEGIIPYLTLKRPQAILALALFTRIDRTNEELQERIHMRLKELKHAVTI